MKGLTAEWATREYHSLIAAAPQLIAHHLTQCGGMETQLCTDKVDGQDAETGLFTPVCSIPPPFMGMREVNLSSQEEMGFLSAEKQAVSVVHP